MPKTGAATELLADPEARSLLLAVTEKLQIASPRHTRAFLSPRAVIEIMTAPLGSPFGVWWRLHLERFDNSRQPQPAIPVRCMHATS